MSLFGCTSFPCTRRDTQNVSLVQQIIEDSILEKNEEPSLQSYYWRIILPFSFQMKKNERSLKMCSNTIIEDINGLFIYSSDFNSLEVKKRIQIELDSILSYHLIDLLTLNGKVLWMMISGNNQVATCYWSHPVV